MGLSSGEQGQNLVGCNFPFAIRRLNILQALLVLIWFKMALEVETAGFKVAGAGGGSSAAAISFGLSRWPLSISGQFTAVNLS